MKKQFPEYYLGFDIGTNSVGWAVTDEEYNIFRFNGKSMWGTHVFEEGKTAQERRTFRSSRRRLQRKKERLDLFKDMFRDEIAKVDNKFFERLQDSKFYPDDKNYYQKNTLFNDEDYNDKKHHNKYPTIHHLRSELIHNRGHHDIRLIYLAIHNILKNRGHFLYENSNFAITGSFHSIFTKMIDTLSDYGVEFDISETQDIENLLKDRTISINDKQKQLYMLMNTGKDVQKKKICNLLVGGKVKLSDIFDDKSLDDTDVSEISFKNGIDDKEDIIEQVLQDKSFIIYIIKSVYDWSVLADILQGESYLSDAKIKIYDQHRQDLRILKQMTKKYLSEEEYENIFLNNTKGNYCNYVGKDIEGKRIENDKGARISVCSQEEFCKFLDKRFKNISPNEQFEIELIDRINLSTAFPKQISKDNSVIPYQLHKKELEIILENAAVHYPFISQKDDDGYSIKDKILSLIDFRVPYYVGPLNSNSKFAWIKKKTDKKIYPWNFEEVVDKNASASEFIKKMTNKCTYLYDEDVLAKDSIIYSKYNILNQLNNLMINEEKISVTLKQDIFNDNFINSTKKTKFTVKKLKEYIKIRENINIDFELTGIDEEIQGDIKALRDFKKICPDNMPSEDIIDDIVEKIVVLGESKDLLRDYLTSEYLDVFNDEQIAKITRLKYSGWGRFSAKFLTEIEHIDSTTGECINIIDMMYNTNNNLMQCLSYNYTFNAKIDEYNSKHKDLKNIRQMIEESYVSPAIKRSMIRTSSIAKEIVKITGKSPKKIFIEMARGADEIAKKKGKTQSRKDYLISLYKNAKLDEQYLLEQLESYDVGQIRSNRLYLYYLQMGKCMYSGERIELSELYNDNIYDIDHIIPRSKKKDDSIENKVLVKRVLNSKKGDDKFPLQIITSPDVKSYWKMLLDKGFMSKEKYKRLTRNRPFTPEELGGFIARQIVETRQSTKVIADIFKKIYPRSTVVYVKAGNVSDFRRGKKEKDGSLKYQMIKSRLVNDHHHAKDAYLNIVVGNVYHEKFTSKPYQFIKSGEKYSLNKVFDYTVKRGEKIIWNAESDESYKKVYSQMQKNNVLFTRYCTVKKSKFFDQMPVKAGTGQYPLKTTDKRLHNIDRYGAYNKVEGAYFFFAEYDKQEKKSLVRERSILDFPVYLLKEVERDSNYLVDYCTNILNLNNPKILIPKIKINTLFKVNGFYMHLSSKNGDTFTIKNANQLILSDKLYKYTKKIENYIDRNNKDNTIYPITKYQDITKEENLNLYDELYYKLTNTIYCLKLSTPAKIFEKGKDKFIDLSIENQCQFLYNSVQLFGTSPSGKDMSLVGGTKSAGRLTISPKIKDADKISIIYQSVTGLFEKEVDLNKI